MQLNSSSLATRAAAAKLIGDVLRGRKTFETAFTHLENIDEITLRDRAFIRNLTLTTFRRLGQIDQIIDSYLERPLPKQVKRVRDLIRIGACQLLFMNVADHAAVTTCVELTRKQGFSTHIKLVNAILRRLSQEGASLVAGQDEARLNTPPWLWQTWLDAFGERKCREIAAAHMRGGNLDISTSGDPETWSKKMNGKTLPSGTVRLSSRGPIQDLPGFYDGKWWVQDMAANLTAGLVGDISGKTVLDLCAAPGGKTAYFAAIGGKITAVDRSTSRLSFLNKNITRLGLDVQVIEADILKWQPNKLAQIVMLDAPCSATGIARRHPDILWTKSAEDVKKLAHVQQKMLRAAAKMVAPGGLMIFATCSLQREEGVDHITPFLSEQPGFTLAPVTSADVYGIRNLIEGPGFLRSLPCHLSREGGMDGFFAARFRRK